MSYTAQELNRKITFRRVTITQNPVTGEMVETWADFVSVFAKIEPLAERVGLDVCSASELGEEEFIAGL